MRKNVFYEIAVAAPGAKRGAVFTYTSLTPIKPGALVLVELKKKIYPGVILQKARQPDFDVKAITELTGLQLPGAQFELLRWMLGYYPFEQGNVVRLFTPTLQTSPKKALPELMPSESLEVKLPPLTKNQVKAVGQLSVAKGVAMLHGETGSGKTRVYIELVHSNLKRGKSVIVLTPEISLSEQLFKELSNHFSGLVKYHSLMTPAERRNIWLQLRSSREPHIVIGPRSALLLPINNIGLIIMDEAHDASYKHQQSPHYNTLQVAASLTSISKGLLIYGSATPNASDYYVALKKKYPVIRMTERPVALATNLKRQLKVINIRDRSKFTKSSLLSNDVINTSLISAKNGKQSIFLLNRRGTAQLIRCDICAWDYRCKVCDHALVYHHDIHAAACHVCSRKYTMPHICPDCGNSIKFFSMGTKYIEEECRNLFPSEKITRLDTDSVDRKTISKTLEDITSGESTIIVGTQLLAKGLDLPLLENVTIVDASRQSNDFLGDERYYQLLHQVIGRASRGHQSTTIFVQTNSPEDPIIQWATKEDWQSFYDHEIEERHLYGYPPFRHIALLKFEKRHASTVEKIVEKYITSLKKTDIRFELVGPLRSFTTPSRLPTWQILIKTLKRTDLLIAASQAPADWSIDLEPINV